MKTMLIAATATALACLALPAAAQDYDPAMAAHESMSQQQFSTQQTEIGNHMLRESVRRNRGGGSTAGQRAACARKKTYRAQYGANSRQVQRLYQLCRGIGR